MWVPPFYSRGAFYGTVIPAVPKLKRFVGRRRRGQPKDKIPSRAAVFTGVSGAGEIHGAKPLKLLRKKRMVFNNVVNEHIDHFTKEQKSPMLSRVMVSVLKDFRSEVNGPGELRRTEGVHSEFIEFLLEWKRNEARRKLLNSSF